MGDRGFVVVVLVFCWIELIGRLLLVMDTDFENRTVGIFKNSRLVFFKNTVARKPFRYFFPVLSGIPGKRVSAFFPIFSGIPARRISVF